MVGDGSVFYACRCYSTHVHAYPFQVTAWVRQADLSVWTIQGPPKKVFPLQNDSENMKGTSNHLNGNAFVKL